MPPKMKAYQELEEMLVPISQELDYDKELAEARNEKYSSFVIDTKEGITNHSNEMCLNRQNEE